MTRFDDMKGVFGLLPTQYKNDLEIDLGEMKRLANFCCDSGQHGICIYGFDHDVRFALDNGVDRYEVILVIDLQPVTRVIEKPDRRATRRGETTAKFLDGALHCLLVCVDAFDNVEAETPQSGGNEARIIGGIGQRLLVYVGAVADDEGNSLRAERYVRKHQENRAVDYQQPLRQNSQFYMYSLSHCFS